MHLNQDVPATDTNAERAPCEKNVLSIAEEREAKGLIFQAKDHTFILLLWQVFD
jgi:hypothetical protein